ncbi:uncharacterized protein DUF1080 [Neolewinella xylanilytica]|uniref:Uncharacterized protein DUF1080 n=1 Tax=Neolewinella xylanilytica TaxID=1514080 RepID=A0A2S6I0M3_9BACT|nr:DUF1080 domain-containing protein [Neolewinella xylanilytica]PPK84518.1 uncharacterized protein DUF1080 [Neolewinella xylanilytica]
MTAYRPEFRYLILLLAGLAGIASCTPARQPSATAPPVAAGWVDLLDRELTDWDTYLSFRHQLGYDGSAPVDEGGNPIEPIGMNPEGYDVFTTQEEAGEEVIRVSGEVYGCLISKEEFENYHLQVQYRWGDEKWVPRQALLKDSGVLYHSIGPPGAEHWRTWMLSQEFQIMEGHTGDYWNQASSAMDIRAYTPEYLMNPMANATQDYLHIGEGGPYKNYCLRSNDYERPHGEWNTLDLICYGDKALHIVNGEVVMILKNSRYVNEAGEVVPLTKGKIQLQSEAAEVFFRGIRVRPLEGMPAEYAALF